MDILLQHKKQLNIRAELSWQEKKTTAYILDTLKLARPLIKGFGKAKTGVLYQIGNGKKGILLRADIDGLQTDEGTKHTCGHSSHTAALIQTLLETIPLADMLTKQNKKIYFLFQPSEENYPSGAKTFIDTCSHIIPHISYAFAAHVRPRMPLGTIGLQQGVIWGRGDYMEIEIKGKMVHIKDAPSGIDALEVAAEMILFVKQLQKKYSKHVRINIGVAQGGYQANTVADSALLKGDIRMDNNLYQTKIKNRLNEKIHMLEKTYKASITLHYFDGYPVVENNPKLTTTVQRIMKKLFPTIRIQHSLLFSYGCEDFCFISEKIPAVMAFVGTGDTYDIHEKECTISDKGTKMVYNYFSAIRDWWTKFT